MADIEWFPGDGTFAEQRPADVQAELERLLEEYDAENPPDDGD